MTILACINICAPTLHSLHSVTLRNKLTIWLRGARLRGGELAVPGGGVGQHLDAVVGEGEEALERGARPDHCAQARRVELGLSGLVRGGEGDEEDAVTLDLAVPGLVRGCPPLEMEPGRG